MLGSSKVLCMGPCSLKPKSRQTEEEINTQSANHTQLNQNVFCSRVIPHPLLKDQQGKEKNRTRNCLEFKYRPWMVLDNKLAVHFLALMPFLYSAPLWTCVVSWQGLRPNKYLCPKVANVIWKDKGFQQFSVWKQWARRSFLLHDTFNCWEKQNRTVPLKS